MGRMMTKKGTARGGCRPYSCGALAVVCVLGLMTMFLSGGEEKHVKLLSRWYAPKSEHEARGTGYAVTDVPSLMQAIRRATEQASGGALTDGERASWQARHPCRSRGELEPFYARRKFVRHVQRNRKWAAVLREYAALHRTCLRRVDWNATRYFLERNESAGCQFAVAGGPTWAGLGNKVLPTLAVLLYAVLTQRVLLVPVASGLPDIMCEPFEGSSWGVDPGALFTPSEKHEDDWRPFSEFEARVDGHASRKPYAVRVASWCQPEPRFFCNREQELLQAEVPWLYFTSCILFLPKLFAIPAFRPVLDDLFPDRMAATHMLRSVMHPADPVWARVRNVDALYLRHADRRLGVQVRYRDLDPQFRAIHALVNARVLQCARGHNILPLINTTLPSSATTIFVASLFPDLRDHLSELYHHPAAVRVFQLSHGEVQKFGLEEDMQALVEVLCLSFSDDLFVTPLSTFGGMAQAYGALTPYFLEFRNGSSLPPCERGQSVDPCHQDPVIAYACPHDRSFDKKSITDVVDSIRPCPVIDTPRGVQLVTIPHPSVDDESTSSL